MKNSYKLIVIALVGVFVINLYANNEIRKDLINNEYNSETSNSNIIEIQESVQSQNWYTNTLFGLVFETPKRITEEPMEIPREAEDHFSDVYSYIFMDDDVIVRFMVFDLIPNEFDVRNGLERGMRNLINLVDGTNIQLLDSNHKCNSRNLDLYFIRR